MAKKDKKKDEKNQAPTPPEKTEKEETPQAKEPPTIKVKLPKKITAYGGGFYDSESGTWIRGKGTHQVPRTNFVISKIANKELIEVQ